MKNMTSDNPNKFNYTFDGRNLSIMGVKDTSAIKVNIPQVIDSHDVNIIGNGAFSPCRKLRRVIMPDTVTQIDNSAFKGCESLVEVEMSSELQSIGALAFAECSELKKITISNHMRFEINSFKNCRNLRQVDVKYRNSDKVREFVIASEADEARWLYLRAIMSATDPHSGYMDKYDATFLEINDETDRYNIAVYRLNNQFELTDDAKKIYTDALSGMVMNIIRYDRVERLTTLGRLGCINNDSLHDYVDYASRIGGGCIAYLLEYQRRTGKLENHDFSL